MSHPAPTSAPSPRPPITLIVGGIVKREKLARLRADTSLDLEWIALDSGRSAAAVRSIAARLRSGRIDRIVLLEGLLDHKQSEPIVAAAREAGALFAYAHKGGLSSLLAALLDLEIRALAQAAASASSALLDLKSRTRAAG